jgi:MFS family permease
MRFGLRGPIALGMFLVAAGLLLFSFAPVDGNFVTHILPGMILLGFGPGLALNPVLLAVMGDVAPNESGLASGIANTGFMMGGALGLAALASLAAARASGLGAGGENALVALNDGYHLAFLVGAIFAAASAIIAAALLRNPQNVPGQDAVPAAH